MPVEVIAGQLTDTCFKYAVESTCPQPQPSAADQLLSVVIDGREGASEVGLHLLTSSFPQGEDVSKQDKCLSLRELRKTGKGKSSVEFHVTQSEEEVVSVRGAGGGGVRSPFTLAKLSKVTG